LTTKIHAPPDTFGRLLPFCIMPGQANDIGSAPGLLDGQSAKAVVADKAHDSHALRNRIVGTERRSRDPAEAQPAGRPPARRQHQQAPQPDRAMPRASQVVSPPASTDALSTSPASSISPPHDLATVTVDPA